MAPRASKCVPTHWLGRMGARIFVHACMDEVSSLGVQVGVMAPTCLEMRAKALIQSHGCTDMHACMYGWGLWPRGRAGVMASCASKCVPMHQPGHMIARICVHACMDASMHMHAFVRIKSDGVKLEMSRSPRKCTYTESVCAHLSCHTPCSNFLKPRKWTSKTHIDRLAMTQKEPHSRIYYLFKWIATEVEYKITFHY